MGLEQNFRGHLASYQQLVHAASNTAIRTPIRPAMRFRPKLAASRAKSGPNTSLDWVVAAGTASMVIGGPPCEVRPDCGRSRIGHEQAERQKRTDCDVVVVHKILLGQW